MKNKKDLLSLGLIAAGAVFLFNPTVNIVDLLPDFIGFWLIAAGLTAFSYLSELLLSARRSFIYLTLISAAKLLVCLTLPGANGTYVVLMTFSFAVAEAVLFISGMSNLFEGLLSIGMRFGSKNIFAVPLTRSKKRRLSNIENCLAKEVSEARKASLEKERVKVMRTMSISGLKIFTVITFLVRTVSAVIPNLPSLMLYGDTLFVTSGRIEWTNYVGVFYIVGWICTFATGIPWLIKFRRYFKGVVADREFTAAVYEKYETEILSDKGRLCADMMRKVMLLTLCAIFFVAYVPIDYMNAFPNFISAALVIAALVYLFNEAKGLCIAGIGTSAIWAVLSAVGEWLQYDYRLNNYDPGAAVAFGGTGRGMADELYFRMELFSYAEAVFFLITAVLFARVLVKALNRHISMMPPRRDGLSREPKKLKKCLLPVGISGGVVILFNFGITFVTKYFTGIWLINLIAVIVMFVFALLAYFKLSDTVYLPLRRKY